MKLAPSPDSGWASYVAKDFLKPFKWKHRFAATRGLAAAACEVFVGMVTFVSSSDNSNAKDKPALTANIDAENMVSFFTKALVSPDLDRVAIDCGQQMEAEECSGRRLQLTGLRTCSKKWRVGRVPTLDTS